MCKMRGGTDTAETSAISPPSPLTVPAEMYKGIFEAAKRRLPSYRVGLDTKDFASEATGKDPLRGRLR
jgi:hypothetical protein